MSTTTTTTSNGTVAAGATASNSPTSGERVTRFSRTFRCPVCKGCDDDPRGQGVRCHGYLSSDGEFIYCSREEHAGGLALNDGPDCFPHRAHGNCDCGVEHAPAELNSKEMPATERGTPTGSNGKPKKPANSRTKKVHPTIKEALDRITYAKSRELGRKRVRAKAWIYHGADGRDHMAVARFDLPNGEKDYLPFHPVEGGWSAGDPPGKLPLYRLPEVVQAARVFFVEGEKSAELVRKLGLTATTTAHGAKSPEKSDFTALAGKEVIALPDHDDPGEAYIDHVAALVAELDPAPLFKVVRLPLTGKGDDVEQWLAAGGTVDQLRELADQAPDWEPPKPSSNGVNGHTHATIPGPSVKDQSKGGPKDGDPIKIIIEPTEVIAVAECLRALSTESTIFQRAHLMVTIRHDASPAKRMNQPAGTPVIAPITKARLREYLSAYQWNNNKGKPARPDSAIVDMVFDRQEYPVEQIRPIEGVVETPTLRPDGSLLDESGYDPITGLVYEPSIKFPAIAAQPTREEAQRAAGALYFIVADFPFAGDPDKAAWLAGLLTALVRFAIDGACPLFRFDANCAGTGKSKLCDLIACIVTGRVMTRSGYPGEDVEMEKLLLSVAIEGTRLLLFDNVATGFSVGGAAIDRILTAGTIKGRILGQSKTTPELPVNTVFFATGNNLGVKGDALRRIVPCRLETIEERPEERADFRITRDCSCGCGGDLLSHTKNARGQLVAAALTILRAYIVAGRPDQGLTPMDYTAWCGLIRNAIYWATGVDPCAGRQELIKNDEATNEARGLIAGWKNLLDSEHRAGMTAGQAIEVIRGEDELPPANRQHTALRELFMKWSKDGSLPNTNVVGRHLRVFKDRKFDGNILRGEPYSGTTVWSVEAAPCNQATPISREAGGLQGLDGLDSRPAPGRTGTHTHDAHARELESSPSSPCSPSEPRSIRDKAPGSTWLAPDSDVWIDEGDA